MTTNAFWFLAGAINRIKPTSVCHSLSIYCFRSSFSYTGQIYCTTTGRYIERKKQIDEKKIELGSVLDDGNTFLLKIRFSNPTTRRYIHLKDY